MAVNFVFMSNHGWVVNNVCKREVGHKWRKGWVGVGHGCLLGCGPFSAWYLLSCGTFMFTDILGI